MLGHWAELQGLAEVTAPPPWPPANLANANSLCRAIDKSTFPKEGCTDWAPVFLGTHTAGVHLVNEAQNLSILFTLYLSSPYFQLISKPKFLLPNWVLPLYSLNPGATAKQGGASLCRPQDLGAPSCVPQKSKRTYYKQNIDLE